MPLPTALASTKKLLPKSAAVTMAPSTTVKDPIPVASRRAEACTYVGGRQEFA